MEGIRVKCVNCGQVRHETTKHYRPDQVPKGNFLRLIEPWSKWRWNCYDDEGEALSTIPCSLMTCPGCSAQLAPSGRLTIAPKLEPKKTQTELNQEIINRIQMDESEESIGFPCEVCGKVCKSKLGLASHMRSHA